MSPQQAYVYDTNSYGASLAFVVSHSREHAIELIKQKIIDECVATDGALDEKGWPVSEAEFSEEDVKELPFGTVHASYQY